MDGTTPSNLSSPNNSDGMIYDHQSLPERENVTTGARDEALAAFEILTLASIFVVTVLGNTIVVYILFQKRKKFRRMNYFISALCISDLVTAAFNVFPQLMWDITFRFRGGDFLCRSVKFGQLVGPYMNSYILVVTAIDRYQVICQPLSNCRWTPGHSIRLISCATAISLLFSIPQLFNFSFREKNGIYDCWADFIPGWGVTAYVTWYAIAVFFIPLVLLIFFSGCICCALLRYNFQVPNQSSYVSRSHSQAGQESPNNETTSRKYGRTLDDTTHGSSSTVNDVNYGNAVRILSYSSATNKARNTVIEHGCRYRFQKTPGAKTVMSPISRAKIKTIKLTMIVIFFFIVCSAPFITSLMWSVWDPNASKSPFFTGEKISFNRSSFHDPDAAGVSEQRSQPLDLLGASRALQFLQPLDVSPATTATTTVCQERPVEPASSPSGWNISQLLQLRRRRH
ncbi:hypothetical protein HAZT_HAZT003176 [Hyalella azteca]|uniref:G-protein coupled receptors family 1 profile domain-containing protein n=1 Tax=Hyalella azteca TaxID=294128 RepID=A0A6A0H5U6_HYAAZ|nr:hypothetical protein HAZT_HAZT003176 [Hyalella azteca]